MTEYLIAARAAIILWTNLALMPTEIVFDVIEAELERRGVEPYWLLRPFIRGPSATALLSERNGGRRLASFLAR